MRVTGYKGVWYVITGYINFVPDYVTKRTFDTREAARNWMRAEKVRLQRVQIFAVNRPEGKLLMLQATFTDSDGNVQVLRGDSVQEIAAQLQDDLPSSIKVTDAAGWVRGWVRGADDWTAT